MKVVATVQKWGNTRAVRLPQGIARQSGLEFGTQVSITVSKSGVLLRPIQPKKKYELSHLLAKCKGANPHREQIRGKRGHERF